jgi:hypothetical protein
MSKSNPIIYLTLCVVQLRAERGERTIRGTTFDRLRVNKFLSPLSLRLPLLTLSLLKIFSAR